MRYRHRSTGITCAVAAAVLVAPTSVAWAYNGGRAVDGDTIELPNGQDVRVVGIDTPEEGRCGAGRAQYATQRFINNGYTLQRVKSENKDHYGRLLRYVIRSDGKDLGTWLIARGYAVARYDSRDGYGYHRNEARYHRLDARQGRNICGFNPTNDRQPGSGGGGNGGGGNKGQLFDNCTEARNAGAAPVYRGEPGYSSDLDADGDGVGCE